MSVSSPPSLSKIVTEFGGTSALSAYIRNGSYVAKTTTNAAVSLTSAGLKVSQFTGATKLTASIPSTGDGTTLVSGGLATTPAQTVTTSGFTAGSYLWSRVSGSASVVCSSTTSSAPTFHANPTTSFSAVWRCKITDAGGATLYTNNDTITLTYTP